MAVSGLVLRDSLSEEETFELKWLGKTMLAAGRALGPLEEGPSCLPRRSGTWSTSFSPLWGQESLWAL